VPQGGLIETTDLIQNLAPEGGYQSEWKIRVADLENKYSENGKRKFYFKSQNGQLYGQFSVELNLNGKVLTFSSFWLNPNGSRNLTRPKEYVYCPLRRDVPADSCDLDDYGP
jgi:hypothetical protein